MFRLFRSIFFVFSLLAFLICIPAVIVRALTPPAAAALFDPGENCEGFCWQGINLGTTHPSEVKLLWEHSPAIKRLESSYLLALDGGKDGNGITMAIHLVPSPDGSVILEICLTPVESTPHELTIGDLMAARGSPDKVFSTYNLTRERMWKSLYFARQGNHSAIVKRYSFRLGRNGGELSLDAPLGSLCLRGDDYTPQGLRELSSWRSGVFD